MSNSPKIDAVYDAKSLGKAKVLVLGLQHMFAMFGATVLVPAITGLNVSTTLLFAGLGTLLFHLITGRKVPAFLGSSFAFLSAYGLVTASGQSIPLTYSGFGVAVAGLVYLILALLFGGRGFGFGGGQFHGYGGGTVRRAAGIGGKAVTADATERAIANGLE